MGKFGKNKSFMISVEKFIEICQDSLQVAMHISFWLLTLTKEMAVIDLC